MLRNILSAGSWVCKLDRGKWLELQNSCELAPILCLKNMGTCGTAQQGGGSRPETLQDPMKSEETPD